MKSPSFRKLERVRALLRALCATGFVLALVLVARAHAAQDSSPEASPTQTEGVAPLDPQGNILSTTPTATATPPGSTPAPTPWIQPPPHSRTPMPFTPAMVGGFALILLGISFFWAEAHATSHGVLAAAGVLCVLAGLAFIFGYTLLAITISWSAVGPLIVAVLGLMIWTVYKGIKQMDETPLGDLSEHVGKIVKTSGALSPEGKIELEGVYWNAISTRPVADGKRVRIIGAEGLTLRVEPADEKDTK